MTERTLDITLRNGGSTLFTFGPLLELTVASNSDTKICPADGAGCGRTACRGGRCVERPGETFPSGDASRLTGLQLSIAHGGRPDIAHSHVGLPDARGRVDVSLGSNPDEDRPRWSRVGQDLRLFVTGLTAPVRMTARWTEDLTATALALDADLDRVLRGVAASLLDDSWGRVEGVVAHWSWREYLELHIWTEKTRGRAIELFTGDRFSTRLPGTFTEHAQRTSRYGWGAYTLHTPARPDPRVGAASAHLPDQGNADPDWRRRQAVQLAALELQHHNAAFDWSADRPVSRSADGHGNPE